MTILDNEYVHATDEPTDAVKGPDPAYEELKIEAVTAYVATCRCGISVMYGSQERAVESIREHIEMAHPAWYNLSIRCNASSPFPVGHFRCGRAKGHAGDHAGIGSLFGGWYSWDETS